MRQSRPAPKPAILGLAVGATFLSIISSNVVTVALPKVMVALDADVRSVEWVVTAFMLAYSLMLPVAGWLGDRFGRGPVFVGAIAVFAVGALAAGLSPTLPILVAARVVQAGGAAAMGPTAMSLIHAHYAPEERGRALGVWASGATIASAMGPVLGGFLADRLSWTAVFFLQVPFALGALLAAFRLLDLTPGGRIGGRFDGRGFVGICLAFSGLLFAVNRLSHQGAALLVMGGLGAAALGGVLIVLGPAAGASPLVDPALFSRRNYTLALGLGTARSFALMGASFLMPIYLQHVGGLSVFETALLMLPAPLSFAACSPLSGWLTTKVASRVLATTGIVLVALSLFALGDLGPRPPLGLVAFSQVVRGVGLSLLVSPVMAVALDDMPDERTGTASGFLSITVQFGGALGVAVLNGILIARARGLGLPAGLSSEPGTAAAAFSFAFVAAALVSLLALPAALGIRSAAAPRQPSPPVSPPAGA